MFTKIVIRMIVAITVYKVFLNKNMGHVSINSKCTRVNNTRVCMAVQRATSTVMDCPLLDNCYGRVLV